MERMPKPWKRKSVGGAWYSTLGGKQVWLAPAGASKSEAERTLRQMLAEQGRGEVRRRGLSVGDVVSLYLHHKTGRVDRGELSAASTEAGVRFLAPFAKRYRRLPAEQLTEANVLSWLDSAGKWGTTTRASAVIQIKACFAWAKRVGHVAVNPLAEMVREKAVRRIAYPTADQVARAIDASEPPFADLIRALWWTGCRPNEVFTLTASRFDPKEGTWRVLNKTRGKTGVEFRTVYLPPEAVELTRRLAAEHPEGPIFLNRVGRPWNRKTVVMGFHRLQRRNGWGHEMTAYGLRHLWATDALARGESPAIVAEHMGHSDLGMVAKVYGHLSDRGSDLRATVNRVRPSGGSGTPEK